ncbi:MAG TPA: outer membrane protein assembly factor BamA [Xanthobacteraceae bacterium]|nr:outer membrane protein assembly factor BamA [Xanthobacteraceae bacterium]
MRVRAGMIPAILVALTAALAGATASAQEPSRVDAAQRATAQIAAIKVTGNKRVDADTVRSYFHGLSAEALDAGVKALYATNLFADVRVAQHDGHVEIIVEENRLLGRVAFEGNTKIKDADLANAIESKARSAFFRARVQGDVVRIVELYRQRARYDVHVDPKIIEQKDGRVDLVFEIKEGARTGVRKVLFTGNAAYSATTLRGVIKTGQTNFLSILLNNDLYDADKLEADREALRRYYLARGYADVRVAAPVTVYDPDQKGFVVTFAIVEGARYRLASVDVRSEVASVDPAPLNSTLTTRGQDLYNADAIEKAVTALSKQIAANGEPFADVNVRSERVGPDTIDLHYVVEKAPRVYVERIEIHGNTKTRDYVIRREFDFAEGDPLNSALLARAEKRLKGLGYFKTVNITKKPGSTTDRVIVDVALEEQFTGEFQVSGGYSSQDGVIGEVSVGERNLFGRGEQAKLSLSYGQYAKGFDLAFAEPYVLGSRLTFGVELFGKENLANSYQSYDSSSIGGKVSLAAPITEQLTTNVNYALYRQSVTLEPSQGVSSIVIQDAAAAGPSWVSAVGSGVTYSTLDNAKNPTSGMKATFNEEFAGVGGGAQFIKSTDDVRYYQPIADGVTGMVRAQSGYITPWGGQPLPLLDGFFGGPGLVRGFATNGFGPRDITPGSTMDNVGGNIYWATSAELQSAVPFIPPDAGLKFATFADAGSLWRTSSAGTTPGLSQALISNSQAIRSSVGVGLVWDSLLGPIRVDYAYPTSQAANDVTQRFRFSAGGFGF